MPVLIVWVVVVVLSLVVLGVLAYQLMGAFGRLTREVSGLQEDLLPVLAQVQATLDRAATNASDDPAGPALPAAGARQVTGS